MAKKKKPTKGARNHDILLSYKREINLQTKSKPCAKKQYKRVKIKYNDNHY